MKVALVPIGVTVDPVTGRVLRGPDIPTAWGWGALTSEFDVGPGGAPLPAWQTPRACVLIEAPNGQIDQWATQRGDVELFDVDPGVVGILASARAVRPQLVTLRRRDGTTFQRLRPPPPGQRGSARDEFAAAAQQHAASAVQFERQRNAGILAGLPVRPAGGGAGPRIPPAVRRYALLLIGAVGVWAAARLLGWDPHVLLGIVFTDSFSRSGTFDGSSVESPSGYTWGDTDSLNAPATDGSILTWHSGSADRFAVIMEAGAELSGACYAEALIVSGAGIPCGVGVLMNRTRTNSAMTGYFHGFVSGNRSRFYRIDTGTLNTVATAGSATAATGQVHRIETDGSGGFELFEDGGSVVTYGGDTTYTSGSPGLGGENSSTQDDFEGGTLGGGGGATVPPNSLMLMGAGV